jgi:hypothetical protein
MERMLVLPLPLRPISSTFLNSRLILRSSTAVQLWLRTLKKRRSRDNVCRCRAAAGRALHAAHHKGTAARGLSRKMLLQGRGMLKGWASLEPRCGLDCGRLIKGGAGTAACHALSSVAAEAI